MDRKDFGIPKPVAEGDVLELKVESVGSRGDGIAKKDNFVIFVKNAQKDETCKVKITSVKNTYATAEKVEG
ncbi:MAG: TRAM domain-containing protein [Candidatus Micrarchaeota archaeon]